MTDRLAVLCVVFVSACAARPTAKPEAVAQLDIPTPLETPVQPPLVIAAPEPPTDPFSATQLRVTELPCTREKTLRSEVSEVSLQIDFENATDDWLALEWLNFEGKRVRYADLAPRQTYRQQTYVTHPWVAVDPTQRCRGLFVPNAPGVHTVLIGGH